MSSTVDIAGRQPRSETIDQSLGIARQSLYRFAALTLVDPRCGTWGALVDRSNAHIVIAAASLMRDEPLADAHPLGLGELPLSQLDPALVLARLPGNPEALNRIYEQTFGLLVSSNCPPYETEYINSKFTFQRSQGLADIAGFYRAFGLDPSTTHPERHDHLALELEFMAFLLGLERMALESRDSDGTARRTVCQEAQRKFLAEHLVWWVPTFARLLSRQDPGGFYQAVSQFLAAWIAAERSLAGIPVQQGRPAPSTVESLDECSGCLLSGETQP